MCSIHTPKEEIEEITKEDEFLQNTLCSYLDEYLVPRNIEIFRVKGNSAATEEGYYFAYYTEDLIKVNNED